MFLQEDDRLGDERRSFRGIADHVGELPTIVIPSADGEGNLRLRSPPEVDHSRVHSRGPLRALAVSLVRRWSTERMSR